LSSAHQLFKRVPQPDITFIFSDLQIAYLQRQIDNTLFAQEARRLKIDKDPDVQYKIEEFTKGILTQALLEQSVNKNIAVTDQEIKAYYETNKSEFAVPERVKASHILIAVPADASESVKKEKKAKKEKPAKEAKPQGKKEEPEEPKEQPQAE